MSFVDLYAFPSFIPIPELYGHIIGGGENKWLGRVDDDRADIIRVSFEGSNFLGSVVIVDA